jgi:hypothetical protein
MGEYNSLSQCRLIYIRDDFQSLAGEVDGDGRVDERDGELLRHHLDTGHGLFCLAAADLNHDGQVGRKDLELLGLPSVVPKRGEGRSSAACPYYSGRL